MSGFSDKVLLCRLYERTSAKGNRYLAGRLGEAKVVAFMDADAELKFGATACFSVYLQAGEDRKADGDAGGGARQPREPRPTPSPGAGSPPRPGRVQRWERPETEPPTADRPFYDDDVSDIGRGQS